MSQLILRLIWISIFLSILSPGVGHTQNGSNEGTEPSSDDFKRLAVALKVGDPKMVVAVKALVGRQMQKLDETPSSDVTFITLANFIKHPVLEIGYGAYSVGNAIESADTTSFVGTSITVKLTSGVVLEIRNGKKSGQVEVSSRIRLRSSEQAQPHALVQRVRDLVREIIGSATDTSIFYDDGERSRSSPAFYCLRTIQFDKTFDHDLLLRTMADVERVMLTARRPTVDSDDLVMARGGIGTILSQDEKSGYIFIDKVIEGGPASKAGLKDKDIIVAVDDTAMLPKNLNEKPVVPFSVTLADVVDHVKGPLGSPFKVTVSRAPYKTQETITLVRGKLPATLDNKNETPSPAAVKSEGPAKSENAPSKVTTNETRFEGPDGSFVDFNKGYSFTYHRDHLDIVLGHNMARLYGPHFGSKSSKSTGKSGFIKVKPIDPSSLSKETKSKNGLATDQIILDALKEEKDLILKNHSKQGFKIEGTPEMWFPFLDRKTRAISIASRLPSGSQHFVQIVVFRAKNSIYTLTGFFPGSYPIGWVPDCIKAISDGSATSVDQTVATRRGKDEPATAAAKSNPSGKGNKDTSKETMGVFAVWSRLDLEIQVVHGFVKSPADLVKEVEAKVGGTGPPIYAYISKEKDAFLFIQGEGENITALMNLEDMPGDKSLADSMNENSDLPGKFMEFPPGSKRMAYEVSVDTSRVMDKQNSNIEEVAEKVRSVFIARNICKKILEKLSEK